MEVEPGSPGRTPSSWEGGVTFPSLLIQSCWFPCTASGAPAHAAVPGSPWPRVTSCPCPPATLPAASACWALRSSLTHAGRARDWGRGLSSPSPSLFSPNPSLFLSSHSSLFLSPVPWSCWDLGWVCLALGHLSVFHRAARIWDGFGGEMGGEGCGVCQEFTQVWRGRSRWVCLRG